jgi:glycyl-tRNA synthetase
LFCFCCDYWKERKEAIWAKGNSLAATVHGCIPAEAQGSLLEEVANLVESPVPLLGHFDEAFLKLPADVLTTVSHCC